MNFSIELQELEARVAIPYPERAAFLAEVEDALERSYSELRSRGYDAEDARRQALAEIAFTDADLVELGDVHATTVRRVLCRLPSWARRVLEDFGGAVPLMGFIFFLVKEDGMFDFLREGGWIPVSVVLALGGLGLAVELQRAFRWFVLRDHSTRSLSSLSPGPLYLAAACLLSGVLATAAGYRKVLAMAAVDHVPESIVRAGLSESLVGLMVATGVAVMILLMHGWLAAWRLRVYRQDVSAT